MSVVTLTDITVLDNPTKFTNPFQFDITFECISPLADDLEFKIVYVGSAENDAYDQVLDSIMVGPVPVGINKFVFQADSPKVALIPPSEVLGVTVVLIVCSYAGQEFIRVGYYVNNEYDSEELKLEPPETPHIERIVRNILADKPRVTRIPIKWDDRVDPEILPPPSQTDDESRIFIGENGVSAMMDDDDAEDLDEFMEEDDDEDDDEEDSDEGRCMEADEQENTLPNSASSSSEASADKAAAVSHALNAAPASAAVFTGAL